MILKSAALVATLALACLCRAASPEPARVVVLANADDPDSVALAKHYLAARNIPEKNLVVLPLPAAEQISWDDFIVKVRNPLLKRLTDTGLLRGDVDPKPDAEGRTRFHTLYNGIDFLVLCRGVPLKIANDPVRLEAREKALATIPQFAVNHASVDSELALIPRPDTHLVGFVPSPWFEKTDPAPATTADTIRVARLDGPTPSDAKRLVDNAILAEKQGLLGRAYIDEGGPHAKGDQWLEAAASLCRQANFDTTVDKTPALIGDGARFDAPALYFGWYMQDAAGAPAAPGFRFPPGAIAIHIHSFSATTLRDASRGWTGPLVARGVTATVGNVEEPYLELTHNPALFLLALLNGKTAGEAAAFASPALSWQTIFVGDPLYRPFAHDLPAQLADIDSRTDPALAYAVLRAARKLDAEGMPDKAEAMVRLAFTRLPVLALAREILDRELAAKRVPTFATAKLAAVPEDAGLVYETAEKLAQAGRSLESGKLLETQLALGVKLPQAAGALALRIGKADLSSRIAKLYPPTSPAPKS